MYVMFTGIFVFQVIFAPSSTHRVKKLLTLLLLQSQHRQAVLLSAGPQCRKYFSDEADTLPVELMVFKFYERKRRSPRKH